VSTRLISLSFLVAAILLLALGFAQAGTPPAAQIQTQPGSAARGAQLFREKDCVRCHAFGGRGGNGAPDLAQRSERVYTPALLASVMWNHSPRMWATLGGKAYRAPLSSPETADLFAYFYSSLFFNVPGDAARGKLVFEEKNCAECHTEKNGRRPKGPPISEWAQVKDPITWAERMWNHAGKMSATMAQAGISWPQMSPQNMVDLLIYIRDLPAARSQTATFQPGEPDLGRNVFERDCESCHTFGSKQSRKIDLLDRPGPKSLIDYVAAMWNHAPMMRSRMPSFPTLAPGDMRNLVGYLFAQRYFLEKGDAALGQKIYREKNCAFCHEDRRAKTGAPDLRQFGEQFTPVAMASAVWLHGPTMLDVMKKEGLSWPEFHGSEMSNLITYLNSRLPVKTASSKKN
jgi:mono/diheme cytochrome c family protein